MKEEQDKWIKEFRNQMKDYSEPVSEQIWEQLSMELDRPKVIPIYARWRMIAAVIVLLVISSLTVWFFNSPSVYYTQDISKQVNSVMEDKSFSNGVPVEIKEQLKPSKSTSVIAEQLAMSPVPSEKVKIDDVITESLQERKQNDINEEEVMNAERDISRQENDKVGRYNQEEKKTTYGCKGKQFGYSFTSSSKQHTNLWEIGVSVGNIPASVSNTSPGYKSLPRPKSQNSLMMSSPSFSQIPSDDANSTYIMSPINGNNEVYVLNQILSNNVRNTVVSDIKHHMPITVAASVRLHLDEHWACETGLTYTFLSSEIKAGGDSYYYQTEQQLHYVGIPVKMSYAIWESNRFSFYVSAGGAVEKCVSGKTRTVYTTDDEENMSSSGSIKINSLQWSVTSAVGAQYKISRQIGIYAEPGVAYYFNDGSDIQTIRKEHPFNFNLQLGIRFSY